MKRIVIEVIPHSEQRYNTVGDWFDSKTVPNELVIRVSDLGQENQNSLLIIHELVEALLCHSQGISEQAVDEFDLHWEPFRHWTGAELREPGDDPSAPYYHEHQIALGIERIIAARMYVNWPNYEAEIDRVSEEWENEHDLAEAEIKAAEEMKRTSALPCTLTVLCSQRVGHEGQCDEKMKDDIPF